MYFVYPLVSITTMIKKIQQTRVVTPVNKLTFHFIICFITININHRLLYYMLKLLIYRWLASFDEGCTHQGWGWIG